jgi:biotin carboxyl carrier protein
VEIGGRVRRVAVSRADEGWVVAVDGRTLPVNLARVDGHLMSLIIDGRSIEVAIASDPTGSLAMSIASAPVVASVDSGRRWKRKDDHGDAGGTMRIAAPMPGKVVRVLVAPGDQVRARQPLVVVEAMKMENELRAQRDGTIAEVHVREGQSVDAGVLLVVVQS